MAKAIDYDEHDHVPRGATFVPRMVVFLCTTVSLYSYLAKFDWRLIWVMEYSDVFKASFIALAFISSLAITFYCIFYFVFAFSRTKLASIDLLIRAAMVMLVLGVLCIVAAWLLSGEFETEPGWFWLMMSTTVLIVLNIVLDYPKVSASAVTICGACILITANSLGRALASFTVGFGGLRYDVTLKAEKLEDMGLVMITSHHTILYADKKAIVVPTGEIIKLQGAPNAATEDRVRSG